MTNGQTDGALKVAKLRDFEGKSDDLERSSRRRRFHEGRRSNMHGGRNQTKGQRNRGSKSRRGERRGAATGQGQRGGKDKEISIPGKWAAAAECSRSCCTKNSEEIL